MPTTTICALMNTGKSDHAGAGAGRVVTGLQDIFLRLPKDFCRIRCEYSY